MSSNLTKPVGRQSVNHASDVSNVQALLNRHHGANAPWLKLDGRCGPRTIAAIESFQRRSLHMASPDGVVQPGGPTWKALIAGKPHSPAKPVLAHKEQPAEPSPNAVPAGAIAWGARVSSQFKDKVVAIAKDLKTSPDYLMAAMAFESGETFSPSVPNAAGSGAVGLIQFMPNTAVALGTTTAKLSAMTAVEQLDYVHRYFKGFSNKGLSTIEDVYMTILYPKAVGKGTDHVLFEKGTKPVPGKKYAQNRGLDKDKDGKITVGEAAAHVKAKMTKGLRKGYAG